MTRSPFHVTLASFPCIRSTQTKDIATAARFWKQVSDACMRLSLAGKLSQQEFADIKRRFAEEVIPIPSLSAPVSVPTTSQAPANVAPTGIASRYPILTRHKPK